MATIHPTLGVATGASNGSTQIGARAGAITATPATLTVGAPCNGIQSVTAFNAQIDLQWAHEATVDNHRIRAEHSARIIVRLTGGGVVATWSAATEGTGRITDRDTNMTTGQTARINAQGALLKENRPPVTLDVDLATCRYSFRITPWLNAVFTDLNGTQQNSTTATGTLYTGWMELGNWRGLGGLSEVEGGDVSGAQLCLDPRRGQCAVAVLSAICIRDASLGLECRRQRAVARSSRGHVGDPPAVVSSVSD